MDRPYVTDLELLTYMNGHKTTCAFARAQTEETVIMPDYIAGAIA